jgi:hypothetical protein
VIKICLKLIFLNFGRFPSLFIFALN